MKYEITQEQIKELAKWKHGKRLTQEWFPEAFETKLEVGRWYKSNDILKHIFYVTKLFDGKYFYYGFNSAGTYKYNDYYLLASFGLKNGFTKATESEVFEALKKEAVTRGFVVGAKFKSSISEDGRIRTVGIGIFPQFNYYERNDNYLTTSTLKEEWDNDLSSKKNQSNPTIFKNGKWAKIIKEKILSKSEAEELITKLKNYRNDYKIV